MSEIAAVAGLKAMRAELAKQADAIADAAALLGCSRYELRDQQGGFILAPVVVAIAQVDLALLQHEKVVEDARACGVESSPGHPGTYVCERQAGHNGSHEGAAPSDPSSRTRWGSLA